MGGDDLWEGSDGLGPHLPTQAMLRQVRTVALAFVGAYGGEATEAESLADELVAYVDFNWQSLRLRALSRNAELWEKHLLRVLLQRWLGALKHLVGEGPPMRESRARGRVLALAAAVAFPAEDQALLEHIFLYGFSVAETAAAFGLGHAELVQRLRLMWASVRRQAQIPQGLGF